MTAPGPPRARRVAPPAAGGAAGGAGRLETAFCFLALSTFLGAYATIPLRLRGASLMGGESNPFNAASMAFVLVGTLVLIAANWRGFLAAARAGGPVNLFVALALASALWSFHPAVSLRRSLTLVQMVLFAYYLAARFPPERVIRLLGSVLAVALVLSAVLALAVPDVGIMQEADVAGAWCGVFAHKSALGGACALGTLCFAWLWAHEPGRRVLYGAGILLCVCLAVLSMSKTAQLTIALLGPGAAYLRLLRLPGLGKLWASYATLVVLAALAAVSVAFFAELTAAVGKDPTLTGRVPVWASLFGFASGRLLGGYGYTAFFVAGNPDVEDVWRRGGWDMWDAHNTALGLLLELGVPGLVLSQWVLLGAIRRSLRAFSRGGVPWAGFAVGYAMSQALLSLVEMSMFRGDLNSVLLPLFYVALRRVAGGARATPLRAAAPRPAPVPDPAHAARGRGWG